jgi:hypothetical protein
MFTFFRQGADINPGYWGEKVVAGEVKAYTEEMFREWVTEEVARGKESKPHLEWDKIMHFLKGDVVDEGAYPDVARQAVEDWNNGLGQTMGFTFYTDEGVDFTDFTGRFLWCCHAIRWGIQQYDNSRKVAAT